MDTGVRRKKIQQKKECTHTHKINHRNRCISCSIYLSIKNLKSREYYMIIFIIIKNVAENEEEENNVLFI
jgi:hypothetical protein